MWETLHNWNKPASRALSGAVSATAIGTMVGTLWKMTGSPLWPALGFAWWVVWVLLLKAEEKAGKL